MKARNNSDKHGRYSKILQLCAVTGLALTVGAESIAKRLWAQAAEGTSQETTIAAPGATPEERTLQRLQSREMILNPVLYQHSPSAEEEAAAQAIMKPRMYSTPEEASATAAILNPEQKQTVLTPDQQAALAAILDPRGQTKPSGLGAVRWFFGQDESEIVEAQTAPDPLVLPDNTDNSQAPSSVSR